MKGKTITTTREYDDQGRVTKETTVEVEWPEPYRDSGQWWQTPTYPWWQYPTATWTVSSNTGQLLMNTAVREELTAALDVMYEAGSGAY